MGMLTRHNMFEPLLEALPEVRPLWTAFAREWNAADELPNYVLIGDVARYLTDRLEAGSTREVIAGLAVCERWLIEGDAYVREAAAVGLIEDLQNLAQRRNLAEENWTSLLGPESRRWWEKVSDLWLKGKSLVDKDPSSD